MPDNRMGDEPTIDLPRQPIANNPSFGVQRMLDGHKYPGGDGNTAMNEDELRNIHEVD